MHNGKIVLGQMLYPIRSQYEFHGIGSIIKLLEV